MMLISCIMPTMRGRERLASLAIECWAEQDYSERELVLVLDEGMGTPWLPGGAGGPIRLVWTPGQATIGEKFNAGIEAAAGDLLALWADDDWQASWRLARQAALFERFPELDIAGCDRMLYLDLETLQAARYWYVPGIVTNAYLVGGTMTFRRRFWEERPFEASSSGEDNRWVQGRMGGPNVLSQPDESFYVAMRHGRNTGQVPSALWGQHPQWELLSVGHIEQLMGRDALVRWREAAMGEPVQ